MNSRNDNDGLAYYVLVTPFAMLLPAFMHRLVRYVMPVTQIRAGDDADRRLVGRQQLGRGLVLAACGMGQFALSMSGRFVQVPPAIRDGTRIGAAITLVDAVWGYWPHMSDGERLVMYGVTLLTLIYSACLVAA